MGYVEARVKTLWKMNIKCQSLLLSMQVFREAIKAALAYKDNSTDYLDEVMRELEVS